MSTGPKGLSKKTKVLSCGGHWHYNNITCMMHRAGEREHSKAVQLICADWRVEAAEPSSRRQWHWGADETLSDSWFSLCVQTVPLSKNASSRSGHTTHTRIYTHTQTAIISIIWGPSELRKTPRKIECRFARITSS